MGRSVRQTLPTPDLMSTQSQQNTMEETCDEGILCKHCHQDTPMYPQKDTPMYPQKDSEEDCSLYCADCYWDLDAERKRKRRSFQKQNPEVFEEYRKHVADVLGVTYIPLTKEETKIEAK
jgi:hypothetical protein